MALVDELLVGLGFDYDPKEAEKFKKDIGKTVSVVKQLTKVAVGAATAITTMTVASARGSDRQGKLADEIGETVEVVGALQYAQKIAGGTADGMSNSLRELSLRASEAARGTGSGVEAFGLLGISVTEANGKIKGSSQLMKEVSARIQGLDRARQIELADKLGLRDSIKLLQLGPDAIQELSDKAMALGSTTAEDAAIAAEFNDSLIDLWSIVKQVSRVVSRSFAPALEGIVSSFTDWWLVNRKVIEQNIPKWIDGFTTALKLLSIAMGVFIGMKVVMYLTQLVALMRSLTVATMAANAAFFLIPALIALAATSFVALVEDAKVFFEGGESFIGDMLEKYPEWADEISVVSSALATVYDLTMMIFDGWGKIFNLFDKFTVEDFMEVLRNLPGFAGDVTGLSTVEGTGLIPEAKNKFKKAYDPVADNVGSAVNSVVEGTRTALKLIGLGSKTERVETIERDSTSTNTIERETLVDFNPIDLSGMLGSMDLKDMFGDTGLDYIGKENNSFDPNMLNIPASSQTNNNSRSVSVDRVEITVEGGNDSAQNIANSVHEIFLQTSQDLNSTVDQ